MSKRAEPLVTWPLIAIFACVTMICVDFALLKNQGWAADTRFAASIYADLFIAGVGLAGLARSGGSMTLVFNIASWLTLVGIVIAKGVVVFVNLFVELWG